MQMREIYAYLGILRNQLISNTELKGPFHTDEDLHGMSIKPVRPHSEACNVWLRVNLLKETKRNNVWKRV